MSDRYLLTPTYLVNEVARLVPAGRAPGWHRVDWRHRTSSLRLNLDEYSSCYIEPAMRMPRAVECNPLPGFMHGPKMMGSVVRDGVEVDLIGDYDIQTDEYVFAAFYK